MKANYSKIEELISTYRKKETEIKKRLEEFQRIPESEYFYELVYCLFTPQTSAKNAFKVVEEMRKEDYFISPFPLQKYLHQKDGTYIRFHNQKEKYVKYAWSKFENILQIIKSEKNAFEKREILVENVLGLSYKESTHFLRNIGKNENLAILDRHIIANLINYDVLKSQPKTLTKKVYLKIEKSFQDFSNNIKIPINELDLLFWSEQTGIILK